MKETNWQSIIFDFDGVLVESGDIKTQAFADLYQSYGKTIVNKIVSYHRSNGGLSRYNKFRYFQQHILNKPPLTKTEEYDLDKNFSKLVVEAVIASNSVPGADELIQTKATEIPLFIASGTPEAELKTIVARRGIEHYFTEIRGSPKLKETIISEILASYDLQPENVLMIGDALIDYQSAKINNVSFLGRVRKGDKNPFPKNVSIVSNLQALLQ